MKMHKQGRLPMGTTRCPICGGLVKNEATFVKRPTFDFQADAYSQSIEPSLDDAVFAAGTPICKHHEVIAAIGES